MKTSLRLLALVAVACAAALPARASFYFKAAGLYSSPSAIKVSSASAFKGSLKDNLGFTGALGYKFPLLPVRAEAELQYLKNDFGGGSSSAGAISSITGDYSQFTGFANVYYDLPSRYGFAPYLGAGVGLARVDMNNLNVFSGATNVAKFSDGKTAFAWQLMAGLEFHLLGQATFHAGYRLIKHEDIALTNAAAANAVQKVKFGDNHIFELGVAIGF
jgi:opacity protein-like surface antigen